MQIYQFEGSCRAMLVGCMHALLVRQVLWVYLLISCNFGHFGNCIYAHVRVVSAYTKLCELCEARWVRGTVRHH